MQDSLKKIAREWLPPKIVELVKMSVIHSKCRGFSGQYESFQKALEHCGGYEDKSIIERSIALAKEKTYVDTWIRGQTINLFAALSLVLLNKPISRNLRVLDFGGGLGDHYYDFLRFIPNQIELCWDICETPAMVKAGKKFFGKEISYEDDLHKIDERKEFDLILTSGTLQYVDNPEEYFNKLSLLKSDYIIIDRISLIDIAQDAIAIQNVPKELYDASYPVWFFSQNKWISKFQEDYIIKMRWHIPRHPIFFNRTKYFQQGMLLERKK